MSITPTAGPSGALPIEPQTDQKTLGALTEAPLEQAPPVTRGSVPPDRLADLGQALQTALTNDHAGVVSEADARAIVGDALAAIADASDPAAALAAARQTIATAHGNLGRDADAKAILDGFEARAAALVGQTAGAGAVTGAAGGRAALLAAIRDTFTSTDALGDLAGREIDTRDIGAVAGLPASVRASYAYYYQNVEENDWGSVDLHAMQLAGQDVLVASVTTDGDDGYVEVFTADGEPLLSGTTGDGATDWDADFGALRDSVIY